jgi:hypothetical protein
MLIYKKERNEKYIVLPFILFLICFSITGCALFKLPNIEDDFNNGKSIVIVPIFDNEYLETRWSKDDDLENAKNYFLSGLDTRTFFKIKYDFFMIPLDAGTYDIRALHAKTTHFKKRINLTGKKNEEYNSTIGNIILEKTPEQSEGGRTNNLISYYILDYTFDGNYTIGSITIKPNEVVLIPAIWTDIKIAQDTCTPIDIKEDGFGRKLLNSHAKNPFVAVLDAFVTDNGVNTWSWSCPIEAFLVNARKVSIYNFIFSAAAYKISRVPGRNAFWFDRGQDVKFSKNLLDKIVVRDFEIGSALKNAEKTEEMTNDITTIQYKIEKLE